ncbi:hypothetical protein [Acetobacterium woodii]|uniref:hypothetical protein n=1 Tax=Acetobacterium woodii TaxID=33952 RepID=UPI0005A22005|nr:hypothetical protein [Acetobacterium woodii]
MGGVIILFILIIIIAVCQVVLSLQKNRYLGYFIPGLNILGAMILGMLTTDYFVAYLIFGIVLLPTTIWLGIYKLCRNRVNDKARRDMKKLNIKNL